MNFPQHFKRSTYVIGAFFYQVLARGELQCCQSIQITVCCRQAHHTSVGPITTGTGTSTSTNDANILQVSSKVFRDAQRALPRLWRIHLVLQTRWTAVLCLSNVGQCVQLACVHCVLSERRVALLTTCCNLSAHRRRLTLIKQAANQLPRCCAMTRSSPRCATKHHIQV